MSNRKPIKTELTSFANKIKLEDNGFEQIIFAVCINSFSFPKEV